MRPPESNHTPRNRQVGDRRRYPRFEVLGTLWARLELVEQLPVVNVSPGGALMLSNRRMRVDERVRVTLQVDGRAQEVDAAVCHVSLLREAGDQGPQYQVGVSLSQSGEPVLV